MTESEVKHSAISLTNDQNKQLEIFAAQWHQLTAPKSIDRDAVVAAIGRIYKSCELEPPTVIICQSVFQLSVIISLLPVIAIAGGARCELLRELKEQVTDPLWKQMWARLDNQIDQITFPQVDNATLDISHLFGDSVLQLKFASPRSIEAADKLFTDQLSLKTKLRLRQVFRAGDPGNDDWRERITFVRGQFGMVDLQGLVGQSNLYEAFAAQLTKPETKEMLASLLKDRTTDPRPMHFGGSPSSPLETLFKNGNRRLNFPGSTTGLAYVAFVTKNLPVDLPDDTRQQILDWLLLKENFFHTDFMEKLCLLCELPKKAVFNDENRLHNAHGPALEFNDGANVYAWNAVLVPSDAIEATSNLTIAQIDNERNVEVRRVLIQQYGMERYLQDSDAMEIDSSEFGTLYRKTTMTDEPVVVVRVRNPTPESDGTHKFYFLRVPPHMMTAKNAVAWTFNMTEQEYQPLEQS